MPPAPDRPAFDLLHPGVQRELWRMGWPALRPLQEKSIREIVGWPAGEERHAILAAATASGKTEAAFLPVLSLIAEEAEGSVRAVYVGPLKALINDQFSRVEELCTYLEVPVHRWHGDVPAAGKKKLVDSPAGVLLITPESLESLLINKSQYLPRLFGGLRFVVIDEMHSFLDGERGLHLRSLLNRVGRVTREVSPASPVRLIGLSATIGDFSVAKQYLDRQHPERVTLIEDAAGEKETRYRIRGYRIPPAGGQSRVGGAEGTPTDSSPKPPVASSPAPAHAAPSSEAAAAEGTAGADDAVDRRLAADLVRHCAGAANLVFANSKADVEQFAQLCREVAAGQGLPDLFLVHHGSLSADIREEAEAAMKDTARAGRPATAFCSSTLEMGIDIGSVRFVGQIGAPWSVASLKQRIGRSGRKGDDPRIMRVYMRCNEHAPEANVFDRLNLKLVQAVAVSELMLEKWVEPARLPVCDLSTLSQQIISAIAQAGEARADGLYALLCSGGAFPEIEPPLFGRLLRSLAGHDVIEQAPTGELVLGLEGERLRKDKGFYAVFQSPQEYAVLADGRPLGRLAVAPRPGDCLLFAGRRWQVEEVDGTRHELHVKPASGGKKPAFRGEGGVLHGHVRRKMRDVLAGRGSVAYLDAEGQALLDEARDAASAAGLMESPLAALGPSRTAWMTWAGTRAQQTLLAMLSVAGVEAHDQEVALVLDLPLAEARPALAWLANSAADPHALARLIVPRQRRKYDHLLSEELLDESIARGWLDLPGAKAAIEEALA